MIQEIFSARIRIFCKPKYYIFVNKKNTHNHSQPTIYLKPKPATMTPEALSRRDFIRKNSLLGIGMALAPGMAADFSLTSQTGNPENGDIMFFDGFTRIDPRKDKHPAERWSLAHLLEELDHCSISGALVASTQSVYYDPHLGNLSLSNRLKEHTHLFAVWNVMPHQTGEFPAPIELGKQMKEQHVRAVSIHPGTNAWDWQADTSNELFTWLSTNKTLTIVTAGELGGWSNLNRFLLRYPGLPVLLISAFWSEQRYVIPLISRHKNLHVCFDNLQINEGIEFLHEKGLTDQLVFASRAPTMSAGAHRTYIDYADIPNEAKAKIASGNLIRLLKGQKPPRLRINKNEDVLMTAVRKGQPLPVPVVDMHMHMLDEGLNGTGGHYLMHNGGPKAVFSLIKRLGYQGGGMMSWNGVVSNDAVAGNLTTTKALNAAPKGYWGLATFDPTHYTQEELKKMIPEVYKDPRFIGMKPYLLYGVEYHHPSYDVWWEYGNKNKFYALIHNSRSDLLEVETLAKKYPDVRWIIAHAGGSFQMADMAIAVMKKFSNVFAEITLTPVYLGVIEYLVAGAGEDRILYGSDLPMRDPRQQMGWVVFSRLPLSVKEKILGKNARSVIRPCLERLPAYNRPDYFAE
jgi:predicted TIM-barrel fold metal-dependent hydrolase